MNEWKNIFNTKKAEYSQVSGQEKYRFRSMPLASAMGAKKLGFHVEILEPQAFSCPYHFHHSEEELFLVLKGRAMLRQDNKFREVSEGDLIFFPPSPEGAHQFYNHTNEPFEFFALSTKDEFEVCEYPDSGKIMVGKLRKVFQAGAEVDYFKDEKDPSKYWPQAHLSTKISE
jgi:uncharacterized cupin superfamily protein